MQLPKVYEPAAYEDDIYALWEKSGAFAPNLNGKGYFSLVVPPPNANGDLHLGHAMTNAIQDILARYHRMKGESVLFVPGADHAGFETQVVYEKQLAKEGKSRFDFSRDELYKRVWDFVSSSKDNFDRQFRQLGSSVDWSKFTFTLDEKVVKTAYSTFKKMWDEGLIYRGERLVNFCTYHGTAFADIEVAYKEIEGKIWQIKYPLTDGSGEIIVATTRPETMLGDTAVAVHPDDKRYKNFVGKTVKLPLTQREIPILADEFVDQSFGTGAVKITPAHDPNDFDVATRHDLPKISVIGFEGKMTHEVPEPYRGLTVQEARAKVVEELEKQGFLVTVEEHKNNVGHCYKCGTVIEPLLKEQWFVDMQPLAKRAIESLKKNEIKFYPATKKNQLIRYLEGLKDWNISRQIAWGIPIPAFQSLDNPDDWVFDERVEQETIEIEGKTYRRDPDVFDTWFSSSSWPYVVLNYPDGQEFKQFYPLSVMETGGEILYPWVSRMLMLGLYVTGKIPFENVYIHGYVLAEDGAKMSKSIGNVTDPIAELKKYGSDALRMGLIAGRVPAVNRGYDHRKVVDARNFTNKLWNIARFVESALADAKPENAKAQSSSDNWIIAILNDGAEQIGKYLDNYQFGEAYEHLYHLVWDEVADWYVEASKQNPNQGLLAWVLETILKLAHPFAPFATETIWQTLKWENDLLMLRDWPQPLGYDSKEAAKFEDIKKLVEEVRIIASTLQIKTKNIYYTTAPFIENNEELIKNLGKINAITQVSDGKGLQLLSVNGQAWLDVEREDILAYSAKLRLDITEQEKVINTLKARLDNKSYIQNAPKELVQETKDQLAAAEEKMAILQADQQRYSV